MSIVLNKEELATNDLRRDALDILEAGLLAVNTKNILRDKVSVKEGILNIDGYFLDLSSYERVLFVGIGKCALDGAQVLEEILGHYLTIGAVIDVKDSSEAEFLKSKGKIKYLQGTHPLPSEQNVSATREILEMVKGLSEKDLVLTLISGGGSSLFESPIEGVTLEDIVKKTKELTARGADIYELNKARKEMSEVKGGKFAKACFPAKVVSLVFSDVLGNDISVIASGPTFLPSPDLGEVVNILVTSNRDALLKMEARAEELGYKSKIETETLSGNAREIGVKLANIKLEPKSCLLFGGETTVKIGENHGVGGRNQELVLAALAHIKDDEVLISSSSDGWDNTPHAGAIADREIFEKSKSLGLNVEEFLQGSDSYNFWKNCGGAISTGRLGSNVSDLVIMLSK